MSRPQFRCLRYLNLDLHGLIFEMSVQNWQDQPGFSPGIALARARARRAGASLRRPARTPRAHHAPPPPINTDWLFAKARPARGFFQTHARAAANRRAPRPASPSGAARAARRTRLLFASLSFAPTPLGKTLHARSTSASGARTTPPARASAPPPPPSSAHPRQDLGSGANTASRAHAAPAGDLPPPATAHAVLAARARPTPPLRTLRCVAVGTARASHQHCPARRDRGTGAPRACFHTHRTARTSPAPPGQRCASRTSTSPSLHPAHARASAPIARRFRGTRRGSFAGTFHIARARLRFTAAARPPARCAGRTHTRRRSVRAAHRSAATSLAL